MDTGWIDTKDLKLTDIQRKLVFQLEVHEKRAARAYKGVLHLLYGEKYPGWESLLAYGLRDVIDILVEAREHEMVKKVGRTKKIARTVDRTTHSKYDLETEYQALMGIRGTVRDIGHRSAPAQAEGLISMAVEIERILYKLTVSQTKANKEIDGIMSMPPTPDRAEALIHAITTGATQYRIVNKLPPNWIDCMEEAGFFKKPGRYWAATRYLYRCTKHPGSVARIATSYDAMTVRGNGLLYIDILELALLLPDEHTETIARYLLEKGLYNRFGSDPGRYFEIIRRMYTSKKHDLAADMLYRALSQLRGPAAQSRHGSMLDRIGKIVKEHSGDGMVPLMRAMADVLDWYIDTGEDGGTSDEDSSMSKERLHIADSDEDLPDSVKTAMVTHVRDCLYAVERGGGDLRRAMREISGRKHLVWRRMEMHVYCKFPGFGREMEGHALRYVWKDDVRHEYLALLGRAGDMPDDVKRRIQEAIISGPGKEEIDRMYEERGRPELDRMRAEGGGEEVDKMYEILDKRIRTMLDLRRLRRLEAASGWLDGERMDAYMRLSKRYADVPEEEEPVIAGKSTGEALSIMGSRGRQTQYELLDEFSGMIKGDPTRASGMAARLEGADPAVQSKFFAGLEDAVRKGGKIEWVATMKLVRHVISLLSEEDHRTGGPVVAAFNMLRALMRGKRDPGPRQMVWDAVSGLARKPPAGREFGAEDTMFSRSLNDIEGLSFHIMVLYVLWDTGDGLSRRARELLDEYAGDQRMHEASRNAVLGAYMPSLSRRDRGWALGMADSLLCGHNGAAFWNGYVLMNPPYQDFFQPLARWYDAFLNGDRRGGRVHIATFHHVLAAYLHGGEADEIFGRFIGSVRAEEAGLVDRLVSEVDMAMKSWDDHGIEWGKIGDLWTHEAFIGRDLSVWFMGNRHRGVIKDYAKHVDGRSGMHAEFAMTEILVEELGKYAAEFAPEVAGILRRMVDNPADGRVPVGIHAVLDELEGAGGGAAEEAKVVREMAAKLGCGRPG